MELAVVNPTSTPKARISRPLVEIILQGDARVLASDHSLTKAYFGYEET